MRLCLDPNDRNAAIQKEHRVTATLGEILPKLTGASFSIVDAKCRYWKVVLDKESNFKESNYLTPFNSPFGRYKFSRMPFTRHPKLTKYLRGKSECQELQTTL